VRWTIGGDRIVVGFLPLYRLHSIVFFHSVNAFFPLSTLPTINAFFHSIVSTHSLMATIDIVDYYLGAILPSPESVRIDVSFISLPTLTKLGCLPFLRHSHGKPFIFCDILKTVPGLPQSSLLSQLLLVLVALPLPTQHPTWVLRNFNPHAFSPPPPHPLHCLYPCSSVVVVVVDDFLVRYSHPSELDHLVLSLSLLSIYLLYELKVHSS
jgi:hypothetical protein